MTTPGSPFVRQVATPTDGPAKPPPGVWLEQHRYTVLAGGAAGVVALALFKSSSAKRASAAAASSAPVTSANVQGQANTVGTDVYSALEPLMEQLSGFDGTTQIVGSQQKILDAILGLNTGAGTGTPPVGTSGSHVLTAADLKLPFPDLAKSLNVSPTLLYVANPSIQFAAPGSSKPGGQGWFVGNNLVVPTGPGTTFADESAVSAYFKSLQPK